jgi:signal transduction histidine kinase/CHASE3 domain sensor protein
MQYAATAIPTQKHTFQTTGIFVTIVISCLVVDGWMIFNRLQLTAAASQSQQKTITVMGKFADLCTELRQTESDQHIYSLTGQENALVAFNAGVAITKENLSILYQLTADKPLQQERMHEIALLVERKLLSLQKNVNHQDNADEAANEAQFDIIESVKLTNLIEGEVNRANVEEAQLLQSYSQKIKNNTQDTGLLISLGVTLGSLALGVLVMIRYWDLRLRHRTERKLSLSDKRYQCLLDSTDDCFCVIDMIFNSAQQAVNYRFLESNLSFKRLVGVSDDHSLRMRELLPDNAVQWHQIFGAVALSGEPQRFISKSSPAGWFNVYVFRLGGAGSVTLAIGFTDISHIRLVSKKGQGLSNTELGMRQRNAELETANKELASFSYSVSHELKTPLNVMSGFSHLLETAITNNSLDKATLYVGRIRRSVIQMSALVDGLLSLTKQPQKILLTSTVNFSEVAKKIAQDWSEREPERQLDIIIQNNIQARGDANLLPIVIENLMENAWKFSAKQEVSQIEIGCEPDANGQPIYFVKDNGAGFDMSNAEKIFTAFERLHSAAEFPGTGIGLATVKRIVTLHGGRVWAISEKNAGAVFYFTLEA